MTAQPALPGAEWGSHAEISEDGVYRYHLSRFWDPRLAPAIFVMLNPSTADASQDDPTIRKCIGFARRWGMGGIEVMNCFALRSTDAGQLRKHHDPIGPDTNFYLGLLNRYNPRTPVVLAWGGSVESWDLGNAHTLMVASTIMALGLKAQCLGTTKRGSPRHPLMLGYDTKLRPWPVPAAEWGKP